VRFFFGSSTINQRAEDGLSWSQTIHGHKKSKKETKLGKDGVPILPLENSVCRCNRQTDFLMQNIAKHLNTALI